MKFGGKAARGEFESKCEWSLFLVGELRKEHEGFRRFKGFRRLRDFTLSVSCSCSCGERVCDIENGGSFFHDFTKKKNYFFTTRLQA